MSIFENDERNGKEGSYKRRTIILEKVKDMGNLKGFALLRLCVWFAVPCVECKKTINFLLKIIHDRKIK